MRLPEKFEITRIVHSFFAGRLGAGLTRTDHSEKVIEVEISPGGAVNGRIDLIKPLETGETAIVDLKSRKESRSESAKRDQLSIYALLNHQLTGLQADRIQILNVNDRGESTIDFVSSQLLETRTATVGGVAVDIRSTDFASDTHHV